MFKIIPIFVLTLMLAYSCSSSKEKKSSATSAAQDDFSFEDDSPTVGSDDGDDFSDLEDLKEFDFENEKGEPIAAADNFADDFDNEVSGEVAGFDDEFEDFEESPQKRSLSSAVTIGGEIGKYKVKKGETMMLIAFNLYGDYDMWKRIRNLNPGINPNNLKAGQVIKFEQPEKKFVWAPNGSPYLIRSGDTLGTISKDKYGTSKRWKDLYENNRPMIKNPNLIFAGFTLYYIDGESDFAFNN